MHIETVSNKGFHVVIPHGDLTINAFASLTPVLTSIINEHPDNDLVFDFSKVISIDTSAMHLLLNIKKKLESAHRKLYLLKPDEHQKKTLALPAAGAEITIIDSISCLQRNSDTDIYQQYLPLTIPEGDLLRLRSTCGVCGSGNVYGYLLEPSHYRWSWPEGDYFPLCSLPSGKPFDYFNILPIICTDCLSASIDISHFNLLDKDGIVQHHSTLNDQTKLLLSKTIKKRKKLLEDAAVVVGDDFFSPPRGRESAMFCYLLAESCARIASVNHHEESMFNVGYLNYLTLLFADPEKKSGLIDDCRTWLSQVLASPERYTYLQLARSYFILFIAALSLGKYKDISKIMANFTEYMEQIGNLTNASDSLDSPRFWFKRAEAIWQEEVNKKSSAFNVGP